MRLALIPTLVTFFSLSILGTFATSKTTHNHPLQYRFPTKTRASRMHDVVATRQYRVRRDIIDTCISLDGATIAGILNVADPALVDLGDLDVWLETSAAAQLASVLLPLLPNATGLEAIIDLLIDADGVHSVQACVPGEPCAFNCTDGYVESGGTCVCEAPQTECNGACGDFPSGCGSAAARKRSLPKKVIVTLADAQELCGTKAVCGIPGRQGTLEFECVNTSSALDSCGGCMVPHSFIDSHRVFPPAGVDCNRLPGVVNAQCFESKCKVTKCRAGWVLNTDGTHCEVLKLSNTEKGVDLPKLNTDVEANLRIW
ncbi:hypothetical protein C0995_016608 [Termitomyces sp. Mi166|nr:hypothetical protein C0995_016608 [Termitomyces sp. Mi166\